MGEGDARCGLRRVGMGYFWAKKGEDTESRWDERRGPGTKKDMVTARWGRVRGVQQVWEPCLIPGVLGSALHCH